KLHQEIKEEKEKAYQRHEDSKQCNNCPRHLPEEQQGSQRGPWRNQTPWWDNRSRDQRPRLSEEECQYRKEKNLCFNCGYPSHSGHDCSFPFNPNRVLPKDDNKTKSQPAQAHSRKCARVQPLHAESPS